MATTPKPEKDRTWEDHMGSAITWAAAAIKECREAMERTTISNDLRAQATHVAALLVTAKEEALKAARKMGPPEVTQ